MFRKKDMHDLLFLLVSEGAVSGVKMSTIEISERICVPQQTISRWLIEMEKEGIIKREKGSITLTESTVQELMALKRSIESALEKPARIIVSGRVFTGYGDGRYYLSFPEYKKQIKGKLGFIPFPGTLNLRVDNIHLKPMLKIRAARIKGFCKVGRKFGDILYVPAKLKEIECAVIFPERSSYGNDVIEVIAPKNLRRKFRLKDDDRVEVEIRL
ncbi:MAG: DUF120 domain-containing protein [Candidatus Micrarchaeia archaeon]